jgi:hypothetical protein
MLPTRLIVAELKTVNGTASAVPNYEIEVIIGDPLAIMVAGDAASRHVFKH